MVMTDSVSQDPEALKRLSDHYAMPILAVHAPVSARHPACGDRPWGKLVRARAAAEKLGASTVVVHPPFRWQREYSRDFVLGLKRMGEETGHPLRGREHVSVARPFTEVAAYAPGWDVRHADYPHTTLICRTPPSASPIR